MKKWSRNPGDVTKKREQGEVKEDDICNDSPEKGCLILN